MFEIKQGVFFIHSPKVDPDEYVFQGGNVEWDTATPWFEKNAIRNNYLKMYKNRCTYGDEKEVYELSIWYCIRAPDTKICQIKKKRGRKPGPKSNAYYAERGLQKYH